MLLLLWKLLLWKLLLWWSSCSQGNEEDQSQGEGQRFWQSEVQGHGDGCYHYPEGKIRVFPGRHQEPPEQQVQGGRGQEGRHPQQCAEEDARRRSAGSWCAAWQEGGRLFQGVL